MGQLSQVLVHRVPSTQHLVRGQNNKIIASEIFPVGNPAQHKTPQSLQGYGLRHVHGQEIKYNRQNKHL